MSTPTTKSEILQTVHREINKEYIAYDGSNRVQFIYVARAEAVNGDPALVKEFIYYPGTNVVKGRKEGYAVWSGAFLP